MSNTPLPGDKGYKPDPNYVKPELPKDLGGYQHIEHGPVMDGDIWVSHGIPMGLIDKGLVGLDAPYVSNQSDSNIYRKIPQPGHHQPDVVSILKQHGLNPSGNLAGQNASDFVGDYGKLQQMQAVLQTKPSNPKDLVGSDKIPLHLWPTTASALGSLALLDGMLKYGRSNFRVVGVRATIYYDALNRHMNAWIEGEDLDPDSGLPHIAHALACLAVLVDAEAAGKLTDDRLVPGDYRSHIEKLTPHVKRLKEKHKDKSPIHYTIKDRKPLDGNDLCG